MLNSKITDALNVLLTTSRHDNNAWGAFLRLVRDGMLDDTDMFHAAFNLAYQRARGYVRRKDIEEIRDRVDFSKASHPDMMDIWQGLPDVVTVYRGTSKEEYLSEDGLNPSWSLDPLTAEYFAFDIPMDGTRLVLSAQVKKSDIIAMFNFGEQLEVLCLIDKKDAIVVKCE